MAINTFTISLVQFDLRWQNPEQNRDQIQSLIYAGLANQNTDLILLPEMFTTGFTMDNIQLAEKMDGITISWMRKMARQFGAVVAGSMIIHDNEQYFNRFIWCNPEEEEILYYDKRHLFSLAAEDKNYSCGQNKLLIKYRDWHIAPFICYDLRFPVWLRNTEEADLMLFVANWPEKRIKAWNALLEARAIENVTYVAGVNRVGIDGLGISYPGESAVFDFKGEPMSVKSGEVGLIHCTLVKENLIAFRRTYPFLKDRDNFTIS